MSQTIKNMVKNSVLQNDLCDTFSLNVKVNEIDPILYPVVYNFYSRGSCTLFIRLSRDHKYEICGHNLPFRYDTRIYERCRKLYDCYAVYNEYSDAIECYDGLLRRCIYELR